MNFDRDILRIDCRKEAHRISRFIQKQIASQRKEGVVIGLSGGIDSAVSAELCRRALGEERVFGLVLPEKDSNPISREYALKQIRKMGIQADIIDITPTLEGFGTYAKLDEVVKRIFPEYAAGHKMKLTLPPDLLARDSFNFYTMTIDDGSGNIKSSRVNKETLWGIVAATDTKHRTRMMHLYYYAEKMNRLVCGTTNKTEVIQGFFVKYGDGGVDFEPLAHLYKTQVFQMAVYLEVVEEIRLRTPSPDTFSLEVSDEDFYFRIPHERLDLLLYAWENKVEVRDVCAVMGLREEQVERAFRDFTFKYRASQHLRALPPVPRVMSKANRE